MIEVKVTPQSGQGFDKIAERIYNFPGSKSSLSDVRRSYDFMVMLETARTMKEISLFTSSKLAPRWNL